MKKEYLKILVVATTLTTNAFSQSAGNLVITEFMADPAKVSDASGEWIEFYNTSDHVINMNGCHIKDGGSKNHTINNKSPLLILPGSFLLFALKADSSMNGGLHPHYLYSGFSLPNTSGKIILTDSLGSTIDSISYVSCVAGKSWNLDPLHFNSADNNSASNWCTSSTTYGLGDFGTPNDANTACVATAIANAMDKAIFDIRVVDNELIFQVNNAVEKQEWDILDVSGKKVQSGYFPGQTPMYAVMLTKVERGMYFFRLNKIGTCIKFIVK